MIGEKSERCITKQLYISRGANAFTNRCGRFLRCDRKHVAGRHARNGDMEIDPILDGTGYFFIVGKELLAGARTAICAVAGEAAGAGIHRGNQLKSCRILHGSACPGDRNDAVFKRLTEVFQGIASEFRKLVQKEYSAVREGDFSGFRMCAAADEGDAGRGVMRCAERSRR